MTELTAQDWQAIGLSVRIALLSVCWSILPALGVAWLLARSRMPGRDILNALVHLPLVLPPVVTGYLLLLWFGRKGVVGPFFEQIFGLVFSFRWTGAVLAASVMGFPLMVRAMRLSLEAVDRRLETAAATLGAPPVLVFLTVTLPLMLPGIVAGCVLGFAKALGEFGATITFVSAIPGQTRTLAAAIYGYTQVPGGDAPAGQLTVIAVIISVVAVLASELLARRIARATGGA